MSFALHEATALKLSVQKQNVFPILTIIHVRWPARPAEHRAGLDFFGSFCIKAKRT